ncbi:MAG: cytochrome c peroxidase [Pseudomonadota bacterium]
MTLHFLSLARTTSPMRYMIYSSIFLLTVSTASANGLPKPLTDEDFPAVNMAEVELGRQLFWDPILSGNRNISCGTCHHPKHGSGDGVALSLGEGGKGVGPQRVANPENLPEQHIPRNAPAIWNLGAKQWSVLFHDGRIEVDETRVGGLRTPLEDEMVAGFRDLLSAQTMFPVLSQDEMAGQYGENDVSRAVRLGVLTGEGGAWDVIADRVAAIDAYGEQFDAVYPNIADGEPIQFTDISNAISAFVAFEFRSDDSAFDAYLRGSKTLSAQAVEGMQLFYGEAGCAACHSGQLLTDFDFHAMGDLQIGPGKGARFESHSRDIGRARVTNKDADLYKFRTPSLRNVALNAPYGHAGVINDLTAYLKHHTAPRAGWAAFSRDAVEMPDLPGKPVFSIAEDAGEVDAILAAVEFEDRNLPDAQIDALAAFLESLTGEAALRGGRLGIPDSVPSGLPVDR